MKLLRYYIKHQPLPDELRSDGGKGIIGKDPKDTYIASKSGSGLMPCCHQANIRVRQHRLLQPDNNRLLCWELSTDLLQVASTDIKYCNTDYQKFHKFHKFHCDEPASLIQLNEKLASTR